MNTLSAVVKRTFLAVVLMVVGMAAQAQDVELANEYMKNAEYEKAKSIYQKLARNKETAALIHKKYINCLIRLKEVDEAEKFIKRQIKNDDTNPTYIADYARLLEMLNKPEEANKKYTEAVDKAKRNEENTALLAKDFVDANQVEWAIKVLVAGREDSRVESKYALDLARLYRAMGKTDEMFDEYLRFGMLDGGKEYVQAILQDGLKEEKEILAFEKVLYEKVQKFPNEPYYNEMLIWHLVQQKEFGRAFVQARAMDRRYKQEGNKVLELGFLAMQNKDYKASGTIFEYLVKEYPKSSNYPLFRRMLINSKEEVVKSTYPVNQQDIRILINEYQKMFEELGRNQKTLEALRNTALLYAFYLNEKDTASVILETAIKIGAYDPNFVNRCKLDLGDVFLLRGEPWESTLLYSQVEKSAKDSPVGYEAKLKNAKLFYYKGEFDLAKEVLDILKIATTREISNDAIDLSLLIQDNTGMDSTETAMREYAAVELMLFQNRTNEAIEQLNELFKKYKDHPIADEILWLRANTLLKQNLVNEAISDLEKIIKDYSTDILGDDARFLMAKTQEEKVKDKETAMRMYQEILQKYPGSIYGAEARKRFRILRGDTIN